MSKVVEIYGRKIGQNEPVYIVGEIGINHNGDINIAKRLIKIAHKAGLDAVKFQKRTPDLCVPEQQKSRMRETPWGYISYLEYRYKVEFGEKEYRVIDDYCKSLGITWFASVWDEPSIDFMESFGTECYKVPSAMLTNQTILKMIRKTGKPIILSTGMSTMEQIHAAVNCIGDDNLIILHSTSAYPCSPDELNLRMIPTLQKMCNCPIGYSGHEVGLIPSSVAVGLGACLVERHITMDRAMWGSDQSASVEPGGLRRLVKYIRVVEASLGDGEKKVYASEKGILSKLRKVDSFNN